jgi:hypothetical protein
VRKRLTMGLAAGALMAAMLPAAASAAPPVNPGCVGSYTSNIVGFYGGLGTWSADPSDENKGTVWACKQVNGNGNPDKPD